MTSQKAAKIGTFRDIKTFSQALKEQSTNSTKQAQNLLKNTTIYQP